MAYSGLWRFSLLQIWRDYLSKVDLQPYKLRGEPTVEVFTPTEYGRGMRVRISFDVVPK